MEKKLYKINEGKKLCGVCLGLAEYLKMDVSVVRIVVVLLSIFGSFGFWAYVICALILPWKPEEIVDAEVVKHEEN
jgi:phage shock protein PspC (stress-responsive transcriptional regulator)